MRSFSIFALAVACTAPLAFARETYPTHHVARDTLNSYVARAVEDYLDARFDSEDILAALQRRGHIGNFPPLKPIPKPKPIKPRPNGS